MTTIELKIRYDWAYLEDTQAASVGPITNEIVGTNATMNSDTYFKPGTQTGTP